MTKPEKYTQRRNNLEQEIIAIFRLARRTKLRLSDCREAYGRVMAKADIRDSDREYLRGVFNSLSEYTRHEFTRFSYLHPETGVRTDSGVLCDSGYASKLDTTTGEFAWLDSSGSVTEYSY